MPTQRFPRFMISHMKATPTSRSGRPAIGLPFIGSSVPGGTILMTSAPQSASTAPADGAKAYIDASTTRTPESRS